MKSVSQKKATSYQTQLLIDHNIIDFKFYSVIHLRSKFNLDENEKKLLDFLNSKLEAMEKINLEDECLIEGDIETQKINKDKNVIPKLEQSNSIKVNNSTKKIKNKKNNSRKNSKNKSNNKYMVVDHSGKVKKAKIENIDLVDVTNMDVDKEIKGKDLINFFSSNKTLLNSIINEMIDQ